MLSETSHSIDREIDCLREGGESALSEMFVEYDADLKKMVRYRMSAALRARIGESDVIQEGYLEAARQLPAYLESCSILPSVWIRRIVRLALARQIRFHVQTAQRSVECEYEDGLPVADSSSMVFAVADSITSPHSRIARQEVHAEIQQLLESLDPVQRDVLCLKQLENLTFRQIADELDMHISAVKRKFEKALLELGRRAAHLAT